MRAGRVVALATMPTLTLLGALAAVHAPHTALPAARGSGRVAVVVRIITDGHPVELPAVLPVTAHATRTVLRVVVASAPAPRAALPRANRAAPAVRVPVPAPAPSVAPDAYPYASDTTNGADPWGFTKRQCVSYVAWRLADAGRPLSNDADQWGSALNWDDTARRLGRAVTTTPRVGAVAQWNANETSAYYGSSTSPIGSYEAGSLGHVAWVLRVYGDGSVLVAQYNGDGTRTYSTMHVRAPRYLIL